MRYEINNRNSSGVAYYNTYEMYFRNVNCMKEDRDNPIIGKYKIDIFGNIFDLPSNRMIQPITEYPDIIVRLETLKGYRNFSVSELRSEVFTSTELEALNYEFEDRKARLNERRGRDTICSIT